MIKEIKLPDLGEGIETAEVSEVSVSVGDIVKVDDIILVLESEKASMEIPVEQSGIVKEVFINSGDELKKDDVLISLEVEGKDGNDTDVMITEKNSEEDLNPLLEIVLPDLGEGIETAEVSEVSVSVGDIVKVDDIILVLESEKASMEIPVEQSGIVKEVFINSGDELKTGSKIILLELSETKVLNNKIKEKKLVDSKAINKTEDKEQDIQDINQNRGPTKKPFSTPGIRRLARELEIDLSLVGASGLKGRVTKDDLHGYIKNKMNSSSSINISTDILNIDFSKWGEIQEEPLSKIKKVTGQRLQSAWQTIPHVTQFDNADISSINDYRQKLKSDNKPITFLPFIIKAVYETLKEFPEFNSSLSSDGKYLTIKKYFDFGIAVDTPSGLMVPVVRSINDKTLFEISEELKEISNRAREGKLKAEEMKGGTFTISSLGGIGGSYFTPIINPPEVAIMGISKSSWQATYDSINKEITPKFMMPFSLSYDHRVIDGAYAASFTTSFSNNISKIKL